MDVGQITRRQLAAAAEDARMDAGMTVLTMFRDGPWDNDPAVIAAEAALSAFDVAHPDIYAEYVRRDEARCASYEHFIPRP